MHIQLYIDLHRISPRLVLVFFAALIRHRPFAYGFASHFNYALRFVHVKTIEGRTIFRIVLL